MGRIREKKRREKKRREKKRIEEKRRKTIREDQRRSEKRKSQKKEVAGARKSRKVAKHSVFSTICGSGGSKSWLAKAAGAEPSGGMKDEKLHAVVARSTLGSEKTKTPHIEHFWQLRCRKSVRRCCAKHISKSKVLFEVEMLKKCTVLRHEAHFQVKMYKALPVRSTFGS